MIIDQHHVPSMINTILIMIIDQHHAPSLITIFSRRQRQKEPNHSPRPTSSLS